MLCQFADPAFWASVSHRQITVSRCWGCSEDEAEDQRDAALKKARRAFNVNTKKVGFYSRGISFFFFSFPPSLFLSSSNSRLFCYIQGMQELIECGAVDGTPSGIAKFLFTEDGLKKNRIGEYLGEGDKHNLEVLKEFSLLHQFKDMEFDKALRAYLWSFRLPGEAQKIDRMMESFAQRYCDCNKGRFSHTDTCYVLAFSIIMLNTSLHNPACKTKPTLETFINMNRGIDQGNDLDDALLAVG